MTDFWVTFLSLIKQSLNNRDSEAEQFGKPYFLLIIRDRVKSVCKRTEANFAFLASNKP